MLEGNLFIQVLPAFLIEESVHTSKVALPFTRPCLTLQVPLASLRDFGFGWRPWRADKDGCVSGVQTFLLRKSGRQPILRGLKFMKMRTDAEGFAQRNVAAAFGLVMFHDPWLCIRISPFFLANAKKQKAGIMSRLLAVCREGSIMHSSTCVQHTEARPRKHEQHFRNESSLRNIPTIETHVRETAREEFLQPLVGLSRRICWKWRATCQCVVDDVQKIFKMAL